MGKRGAPRRGSRIPLILAALAVGCIAGFVWAPFGREGLVTPTSTPSPTAEPSVFALAAGTCVREFDSAWEFEYEQVACDGPHAAIVLGAVPIDDGVVPLQTPELPARPTSTGAPTPPEMLTTPMWPGDEMLASYAQLACESAEQSDAAVTDHLQVQVRWPLAPEWEAGERHYLCFGVLPDASVVPTAS